MLARQRYQYILNLLNDEQVVSVKQLQSMFDVSGMTLWRDLKFLESEGLLKRIHGGVCLTDSQKDSAQSHSNRDGAGPTQRKDNLGFFAASRLVRPGEIIVLDEGDAALSMIPFLKESGCTILTNSLDVVTRVRRHMPECRIFCSGGMFKSDTGSFVGPEAERFFENHKSGTVFITCDGITKSGGVSSSDPLDNEVKKKMISNAERVVLLAPTEVINHQSLTALTTLDNVEIVVTELPDDGSADWLISAGVQVESTEPAGTF